MSKISKGTAKWPHIDGSSIFSYACDVVSHDIGKMSNYGPGVQELIFRGVLSLDASRHTRHEDNSNGFYASNNPFHLAKRQLRKVMTPHSTLHSSVHSRQGLRRLSCHALEIFFWTFKKAIADFSAQIGSGEPGPPSTSQSHFWNTLWFWVFFGPALGHLSPHLSPHHFCASACARASPCIMITVQPLLVLKSLKDIPEATSVCGGMLEIQTTNEPLVLNIEIGNKTITSWWLNQPNLKNMIVKMGSSSPKVRGWKCQKYLKFHHPGIVWDLHPPSKTKRLEPPLSTISWTKPYIQSLKSRDIASPTSSSPIIIFFSGQGLPLSIYFLPRKKQLWHELNGLVVS